MRALLYIFAGIILAACGGSGPGLHVEDAWVRAPANGQSVGTAYFKIINNGPADVLLSARTGAADRTELHTHVMQNNIMKMRKMGSVTIDKNSKLVFEPGGHHIMLFDYSASEAETNLTLTFERAGSITVPAKIHQRAAQHEHHSPE